MAAHNPDGLEAEHTSGGQWRWTFQTAGGASFISPRRYPSKAAALKAGREWHKDFIEGTE